MRRYSETVQADDSASARERGPDSSKLGIHVVTLCNCRNTGRWQGEVLPASEKDPEGWGATDKFTAVLETAGFNPTDLSA